MNRQIRTAVMALLVGLGIPTIGLAAGGITPGDGSGTDNGATCTDDVERAIADTKATCQTDFEACGIDITAELDKLEADITAECNDDPTSPDYYCRVLDVPTLIANTVEETQQDCLDHPSTCGITLETVLSAATFGETEPNDHIVSADHLTSAVPIVGQMYAKADEDWYYIETTQINSIITIWFAENSKAWHVELRDEAGNRLSASNTTATKEFSFDTSVAQVGNYYVVVSNSGEGTDALYQMAVIVNGSDQTDPQPSYNFHDVETEPNNYFTNADFIASNVVTYGQLLDGRDYDVYRIESPGNEILNIDLCYENTTCYGDKAWAMFVVSHLHYGDTPCNSTSTPDANGGLPVTNCMLTDDLTIWLGDSSIAGDAEGNAIPGEYEFTANHIYYLFEYGRFDGSLVGKVDPTWGSDTRIDLALVDPVKYYVVITPILKRKTDTGSIIEVQTVDKKPDLASLIVFPYSDDQYTFRVTRTKLDPSVADNEESAQRATFSNETGKLTIPEVNYAGDVYKMDLRLSARGGRNFVLEQVTPVSGPATLP